MKEAALAFCTGGAVGALFALLALPIPAPRTMAGVAGVAGITLAFIIVTRMKG